MLSLAASNTVAASCCCSSRRLRADVAARAEHPRHPSPRVASHGPATILQPAPAALPVAHAVLHPVQLAAPLEMFGEGATDARQVAGVDAFDQPAIVLGTAPGVAEDRPR